VVDPQTGKHFKLTSLQAVKDLRPGATPLELDIPNIGKVKVERISVDQFKVSHTNTKKTFFTGYAIPPKQSSRAITDPIFATDTAGLKAALPAPPKGNIPWGKVAIGLGVAASGVVIKNTFFPGTPPVENLKGSDGKEIVGKNGETFPTSRLDENGKPVAIEYKKDNDGKLVIDKETGAPTEVAPQQAPADPATGTGTTNETTNTVPPADSALVNKVFADIQADSVSRIYFNALKMPNTELEKQVDQDTLNAIKAAKYANQKANDSNADPATIANETRNVFIHLETAKLYDMMYSLRKAMKQPQPSPTPAEAYQRNRPLSIAVTQARQLYDDLTKQAASANPTDAAKLNATALQFKQRIDKATEIANQLYPGSIPTGSGAAAANPATTDQAQTDTTGQEGQQQQTDAAAPAK
jgi:hypothetical protein